MNVRCVRVFTEPVLMAVTTTFVIVTPIMAVKIVQLNSLAVTHRLARTMDSVFPTWKTKLITSSIVRVKTVSMVKLVKPSAQ